jgi:flagellar biosynthesis protein FliR
MVISLMLLSRYVLGWMARSPVDSSAFIVALQTLPLAGGLLLLIKSSAIAHRLTDEFSETREKSLEELLDSDDET